FDNEKPRSADKTSEAVFFFRILLRHRPKYECVVSVQPICQPMGARRKQGRMRIRAHQSDLFDEAAERPDPRSQIGVLHRAIVEDVALQNGVQRSRIRRYWLRRANCPHEQSKEDNTPWHYSFF